MMEHVTFSENTAIISDVHGNSPALRAVLQEIQDAGCSRIFVLGDIINGIDPGGCIELLASRDDVACLKGNAEHYALTPDLDEFPKREDPLYQDLATLIQWWKAHLSDSELEWLQHLPDLLMWERACLVHDSPQDRMVPQHWHIPGVDEKYQELCYHARGLSPELSDDEHGALVEFMEAHSLSQVFCGHTHTPFCWRIGDTPTGKLVCNAGSVGFTLDGDPRPSWVMVEELPGGESTVTIHRFDYDIDLILEMVDATPEYPGYVHPGRREAYNPSLTERMFTVSV